MKEFDYVVLGSNLLDFMVEAVGLVETCETLIGWGYDDDDLLFLGFQQETIESAKGK